MLVLTWISSNSCKYVKNNANFSCLEWFPWSMSAAVLFWE